MTIPKTRSAFTKILTFVNLKHIKGPRGLLFYQYVKHFQKNILEAFIRTHVEYDDIASFPWPMNSVIIYTPEFAKSVFVENSKVYIKGEQADEVRAIIGNSIGTNNHFESWAKSRSLLSREFTPKAVNQFVNKFNSISTEYFAEKKDSEIVDISEEMKFLTFEIACQTLLGGTLTKLDAEIVNAAVDYTFVVVYKRVFQLFPFPYWLPTPTNFKFKMHISNLNKIVYKLISNEKNNPNPNGNSVLEKLVHAKDEETNFSYSDTELRDEILTLLLAGHETSGSTLTWIFGLLAKHQEVQEKLFNEIKKNSHLSIIELIEAIPYLKWILYESMRLYPAFPVLSRKAAEDTKLGKYFIPKDTNIVIPIYVIQRENKYWPNADQFNPERFSEIGMEKSNAFLPFCRGPRRCVAELFATVEISIIVVNLIKTFKIELIESNLPSEMAFVSLKPIDGLKIKLIKRN